MVCVIGASAVDAVARREHFLRGTSNPAEIRLAPGGVGYRIFSALPEPKMFITALGLDAPGNWLKERLQQEPGTVPLALAGYRSACYLALMEAGELLYGAADMAVIEEGLDWPRLAPHLPELGPADLLVLEANLAPALVQRLLERFAGATRVVFESVSVEKLLRHASVLRGLYLLSGNEEEIRGLAPDPGGIPGGNPVGEGWVQAFLERRGVDNLLVTRGGRGVRLHARSAPGKPLELPPGRLVTTRDSTGAGDRLLAGVLSGLGRRQELPAAVASAMDAVEQSLEEKSL
jgi:sugar/nucleoside kinase (ribokinase family)